MGIFHNEDGRAVLLNMVKVIQDNKQMLGDVDGLIGDGDHGMNMNKGFTIYADQLGSNEVSFSDGLFDLGSVLLNKIGGSMGPIYGTVFMGMSDACDDSETIDAGLLCKMLEAGMNDLYDIVDARPGDKTLVDTLYPAVEALRQNADGDFAEALDKMKAAAEKGRESTVDMVAKYGRASRLGERSRGVPDAGATSCCLILCAMAEGIKGVLR
ncbi:MAG: dihydroxyacetone kinase subunit DhaL [Clostridia bacterium]|nr:dihydroxyacetone kinase subunit DhaL [Clostridia bacterium]